MPYLKAIFRSNRLTDGWYAEPYAGGASAALALLFEEYASRVLINDIDPGIYAFWNSVLNDTEQLCRLVVDTPVTKEEWRRQRTLYSRSSECSILEQGFATFFLNRTNRSGIIASGGMIGGANQVGRWKLDARYNARELVRRIEKVARYRSRIAVSRLDAVDFLAEMATTLPDRSLTYLDPPYFIKGTRRLYTNFYERRDHECIAQVLESYPHRWIVSYDSAAEIAEIYRAKRQRTYVIPYSAHEYTQGSELIILSDDMVEP